MQMVIFIISPELSKLINVIASNIETCLGIVTYKQADDCAKSRKSRELGGTHEY
jgi:hypothetical protein